MKTKAPAEEEIAERLARRDRSKDEWRDAAPLRRIAEADEALGEARTALDQAVHAARLAGFSWAAIGLMLGTSKQAAQQRFG